MGENIMLMYLVSGKACNVKIEFDADLNSYLFAKYDKNNEIVDNQNSILYLCCIVQNLSK